LEPLLWLATVVVGSGLYALLGTTVLGAVVVLAVFVVQIWLAVGRLRDLGMSRWLCLLQLIPVVDIFFLVSLFLAAGLSTHQSGVSAPAVATA